MLLDITGTGFALTDAVHGVPFRWGPKRTLYQTAWTLAGANGNAWLALDRDGDGRIDDSSELFGNFTPQPSPSNGDPNNGFNALAVFDDPRFGGNGNGRLDPGDAAFARLRLWQDRNHNGISEPEELMSLAEAGIGGISLSYTISERTDQYGNHFRYRGRVFDLKGSAVGEIVWDVILRTTPLPTSSN
jgi:hypothetical protein